MTLARRATALAAAAILVCGGRVAAQPPDPSDVRLHVSGGLAMVNMEKGPDSGPYHYGPLGGPAGEFHVAVGDKGRRYGLEGELSVTREVHADQRSRVYRFHTHHRDVFVTAAVRGWPTASRRVSVEPVAGVTVGWGRERFTEVVDISQFQRPMPATLPPETLLYYGFTGGVDVFTSGTRRVQLGITSRLTMLRGRAFAPDGPRTGLGPFVTRVGATLRVDFP